MWLKDSCLITPSSHLVWSLIGQESVNTSTLSSSLTPSCDSFYTGIPITTGFFHLWHSAGIYSIQHLQYRCMTSLIRCIICIQIAIYLSNTHLSNILTPSIHSQGVATLLGWSSITWSAHQSHIASPSYIYSSTILTVILDRIDLLVNYVSILTSMCTSGISCIHHVSIGVILLSVAVLSNSYSPIDQSIRVDYQQDILLEWHTQLSIYLGTIGSLSIASTHNLSLTQTLSLSIFKLSNVCIDILSSYLDRVSSHIRIICTHFHPVSERYYESNSCTYPNPSTSSHLINPSHLAKYLSKLSFSHTLYPQQHIR